MSRASRPSLVRVAMALLLAVCSAHAADWYVRPSQQGSHNGTSWSNAWSLAGIGWASVSPGDTIWLAGGTHTGPFAATRSGTAALPIQVKRVLATDAAPAAASGWDPGFDAQVVINGVFAWGSGNDGTGSYLTIDGRLDTGTSCGIRCDGVSMDTGNTGVVLRYVDLAGPAGAAPYTYSSDLTGFYAVNYSGRGTINSPTLDRCRIHGFVNTMKISINGITVRSSRLYDVNVLNYLDYHGNVIYTVNTTGTCVFTGNEVWNWDSEGIMLKGSNQNWKISNNVFHDSGSVGRALEAEDGPHTVQFNGNTLAGLWRGLNTAQGGTFTASSQSRNNIFWNVDTNSDDSIADSDYNFSDAVSMVGAHSITAGQNPFVAGFQIVGTVGAKYPADKGAALAGEYASDFTGLSRPQGSGWDIGAYEYPASGSAPVITSSLTVGNSGTVGVAYSYQITASNSPTSFNATGLPSGLGVNTASGLISGTPVAAGVSTVTLSASNGFGTGSATMTLTIATAVPTVAFSSVSSNGSESTTAVTLPVTLSAASGQTVTVAYAVTGGTATGGGADFTLASGTLTFAAGVTSQNVALTVVNDALAEANETVVVSLSAPSNATLGTNTTHTYTITNNDTVPTVAFSAAASSGSEATTAVTLPVTLSAASGQTVTVAYAVTGGTATGGGVDFTLASGTLTFAAGVTSQNVALTVVNDALAEANETVVVSLSAPSNATLGANTIQTYTITNNDTVPTVAFSAASSSGSEATTAVTLPVTLSAASGQTVTVAYAVTGGTATGGGVDFTLASGTLTFAAGVTSQNVALTVVNDALAEANETVVMTLSAPSNATLGANTTHTYTITDNDTSPTVAFSTASSSGSEATTAVTLPVTLSAASGQTVTVAYAVTGGTATGGGVDFTLASGTLTFAPGVTAQNVALTVVNDALAEASETVVVSLSTPSNATLGANTTHTYTITDNEPAAVGKTSNGGGGGNCGGGGLLGLISAVGAVFALRRRR